MKKQKKRSLCIALGLLAAFVLWTAAIRLIDVRPIGPQESTVGFAALNRYVHGLTGVHMSLYTVTDWLGLVPFGVAFGFALLGLVQWSKRKRIGKVDQSILVLGGFYLVVMAVYVFFELCVVNYRPVLIDGNLEASYPSSTTMLVLTVMPTAAMQWNARIKKPALRRGVVSVTIVFVALMIVGRLFSGVHWITDIMGGALLSAGLVMLYVSLVDNGAAESIYSN